MGIKVKSVAFNTDDPHQKELWDYCNTRGNFSAYAKAVFFHEMKGAHVVKQEPQEPETDINSFI